MEYNNVNGKIDLSNKNLLEVPWDLCFEKNVITLCLNNNNLKELPKAIVNLKNLQKINLQNNNIVLGYTQRDWLQKLEQNGCEVLFDDNTIPKSNISQIDDRSANEKVTAYFFELPDITELTTDQQKALNEIEPISISGGAGTGKTVVTLWRHRQTIKDRKMSSVLVTYTKTLGFYIRMSLSSLEDKDKDTEKLASKQVYIIKHFPLNGNWKVSEILIDEAQDLSFNMLKQISVHGENISYGADFNQQLYKGAVEEEEIEELFKTHAYPLQRNFRNTYHILNFVKSMLPNFSINQDSLDVLFHGDVSKKIEPRIGIKPQMLITNNENIEIDKIIELMKAMTDNFTSDTHNIAVLLPFGRSGDESVENYHMMLTRKMINCSKYYNEMNTDNIIINNIHITTYKSAKGLEFDTVIIPYIHKFKDFINRSRETKVNEEDYYVAFTRAKKNLFLFSNQELDFVNTKVCDVEKIMNSATIPGIDINEDEIPF